MAGSQLAPVRSCLCRASSKQRTPGRFEPNAMFTTARAACENWRFRSTAWPTCRHEIELRARRGFTLIEVLTVLAIVGVLAGLMLAAVQRVRESAARAKCQNTVRQLALGLHQFHDANGTL